MPSPASPASPASTANPANPVDAALITRRSVRAFLPTPVPRADIEAILEVASRAPSGTNIQPWKVYVLTGDSLARLSRELVAAYDDPQRDTLYQDEYAYYPRRWLSPFVDRRRKIGWDLYSLLGIGRSDKARMHAQHSRNFRFFDAPVGLLFTIDRSLERGSWLDYGMFLQAIMTAARGRGLDTCPQAAFIQFHRLIADYLGLPDNEQFVCGMALGFADESAPVNALRTEREPVEQFARFFD
ncbi:nitroreductase [Paraburkholderia sp.]|jgi:nitroreductase|uniref:nitroreductase n=1 Tax=Paraburkholderia sp. TaxID=1926495 RepID=UPI002F3E9C75